MSATWEEFGIHVSPTDSRVEVQTTCPRCSRERKKKGARCLSVNVEKRCWVCHHCGWSGSLDSGAREARDPHWQRPAYRRPEPRPQVAIPENALSWFRSRGITTEVLARNRIDYGLAYFPQLEEEREAIIFPYTLDGQEVNRKYRTGKSKLFRMEAGCELVLYGLDDVEPESPVWIVEGEMDKLACEVAGVKACVSVPNGAPAVDARSYSSLFAFLEAAEAKLMAASRVILAVDADPPGQKLETELCRRLGIERCSRVRWPDGCKDANDVLMRHGPGELRRLLESAEPFPIEGAVTVGECRDDVVRLYEVGPAPTYQTGWPQVDRLYTVKPGEFSVVTGIPSSGKSNWVDSLVINMASLYGWRFAVFSPESLPIAEHIAHMTEKRLGVPFWPGATRRMSLAEMNDATIWVEDHFTWILPASENDWTVDKVLDIAGQLCLRRGINGLVIDPWNQLESARPQAMSETEYISHCLKRVRTFARQRLVHVWIVAHPTKLYREKGSGKYPVPTLYDISGSANFRNMADNGLVVWRDLSGDDKDEVKIYVQKVRFRHVGRRGTATLRYERATATYRDDSAPVVEERRLPVDDPSF